MEKRFVFHGHAVGATGHIHKPEDVIIWTQGASALPGSGGYSRSQAERVRFGDLLSVEQVRTQTTGDFHEVEQAYTTLSNAVVKGLNVNGRVTADLLEATLISSYRLDGSEPTITPTGTDIVNLRLDGYPITMTIDTDLFTKHATKSSLSRAYSTDNAFHKKHGQRFLASETQKKGAGKRQIPEIRGHIVTSIVSNVQTKHPRAKVNGNVITLDGFGRMFLGELLITEVSRRLTLLRLKLGSPVEGDVSCTDVESNGLIIV